MFIIFFAIPSAPSNGYMYKAVIMQT